jgi:hypothetical protein
MAFYFLVRWDGLFFFDLYRFAFSVKVLEKSRLY